MWRDGERKIAEVAECAKKGVVRSSRHGKAELKASRELLSEFMRDLMLSVIARRLLLKGSLVSA